MTSLNVVRRELAQMNGHKVHILVVGDRNKVTDATGILDGVYPSLFTVRMRSGRRIFHRSFRYSEVITKRVTVTPVAQSPR